MRRLRAGLTATITSSLLATASLLAIAPAAPALEVDEQTSFVAVPTKAKLINYRWYAFEGGAVMYVVMELPPGAQAGLGGISLEQIRGVRPAFYYGAIQPTAFLGTPRRQGAAVPAGSTVTVAFKLGVNPPADLYVYSISATPWGPNPIEQDVGVVQMSILDNGGI